MALVALIALLVAFPLFSFGDTQSESRTETTTAPPVTTPKVTTRPGRATLSLKSLRPLIVAGRGFKAGELVRLTGADTKRVMASRTGSFSVRLAYRDPCGGLTIAAVGSKGSRAGFNVSHLLCVEP
jgi:hypothetical protein